MATVHSKFFDLPQELRDAIYELCTPIDRMFFIPHILEFPNDGQPILKWGSITYTVPTPEYNDVQGTYRRHDDHALARVSKTIFAEYGETQRRLGTATHVINIPAPVYGHVKGSSTIADAFGLYKFPLPWDVTNLVVRLDYSR